VTNAHFLHVLGVDAVGDVGGKLLLEGVLVFLLELLHVVGNVLPLQV